MADEQAPIDIIPSLGEGSVSIRDAANSLTRYREKSNEQEAAPAEAAAPQESSQEDAAPPQEAHGEEGTATPDQPETAPIEMPRSWAKDREALWKGLALDVQEYIVDQDSQRQKGIRQSQNETAEQRKALDAERGQLEQARKSYEEALPMLLQTLQQQQQGEFGDIKTMADVEKLAREDWPRYALWDAQQKKIAAVSGEMKATQDRQAQEFGTKWAEFSAKQDATFIEAHPELADKEKLSKVSNEAVQMLQDHYGFTQSDIQSLREGKSSLAGIDARFQNLVYDAYRFRQAQAAVKKAQVKPVPNVQRPGAAPVKGEDRDIRLTSLEKRLEQTGSWKDAAELLVARRSKH